MIYGYRELTKVEDWEPIVGKAKWKPTRSAYELAHKWHPATQFPPRVAGLLASSSGQNFPPLRINYCCVEKPVFLDNFKAPSCTDIMSYCSTPSDEVVVVGVEGKATETFAQPVRVWVRDGSATPKPSRTRRLKFLGDTLGVAIDTDSLLRYQLIHRSVSVVQEAALHGAAFCVLLVHSFSEAEDGNWSDFVAFLTTIGVTDARKDALLGPAMLGPRRDMRMFVGWVTDEPATRSGVAGNQ